MLRTIFYRVSIVLFAVLLSSCSKKVGTDQGDVSGTQSYGLGEFSRFGGQEAGESYTTKAPHNQIYLFAFDNSHVASKYRESLQAQATYLSEHPGANILLAGHTDERGSREYNIALGERRANAVRDMLKNAGVSSMQIRVVSYGKERPAVEGFTDDAHRQNRRVELIYEAVR